MRYSTIVADPPWDYGSDHKRWPSWATGADAPTRKAIPYPPMSLESIKELPVSTLASESCRLFLWTTNRFLPDAFGVLSAWGFRYTQTLVWAKRAPSPFGGSVAPNGAEFLLVAEVGKPPIRGRAPRSVMDAPRQPHSAKPEAFLDLVETVSEGPYLEMFARRNRLGWDTWGNESLQHVSLVGGVQHQTGLCDCIECELRDGDD